MREFLEECNDPVSLKRNSTELSGFSESMVVAFLSSGAQKAYVRHEKAPYGFEALYRGLYNVTRKKAFEGAVRVHKQNGRIVLVRRRSR